MLLWEGQTRWGKPSPIPVRPGRRPHRVQRAAAQRAPSMCAPTQPCRPHRVKGWELSRAAGHLKELLWCGEGQAQVQGELGGRSKSGGGGVEQTPVSRPGWGTPPGGLHTGEVFLAPRAQLAGRPASGTRSPVSTSILRDGPSASAPSTHPPPAPGPYLPQRCCP